MSELLQRCNLMLFNSGRKEDPQIAVFSNKRLCQTKSNEKYMNIIGSYSPIRLKHLLNNRNRHTPDT